MTRPQALRQFTLAAAILALPGTVLAQSSASFRLTDHTFNLGGRPKDSVVSASPSFRLSLDSIGEPLARSGLSGVSFRTDGGLPAAYRPAGEVKNLQLLANRQTLTWSRESASTAFNVYTGLLSSLPGNFGDCAVAHVAATTWVDETAPAAGSGLFYLVTGENRLGEEGTKGRTSSGAERGNPAPCP